MRIIANRILTSSELESARIDEQELKTYIKKLLAQAVTEKFLTLGNFYEERERGRDTEFVLEAIIFSKETFRTMMTQLMDVLPKNEFERIRDIIINQI